MIKRLLVSVFLFLSFISFAQEGTSSPYSYYGLGEMKFKGTVENRSMGGLSVFPDSIHINLQNPAFYSQLKLVSFTIGASYNTTKLKTNAQSENARRTTLDYLAVGIPMGKFGAGFGLMPYTAVGYKIQNQQTIEDMVQQRQFRGSGGLNKAFIGGAYQINKNLSFGAEGGYYFGNIETSSIYSFGSALIGTRELNESIANGIGFSTGLSYQAKVGKKLQFSAAATYASETTMTLKNSRNISTVNFSSGGITVVDPVNIEVADTKVKMPSRYSFGAGIGENKKWMVGSEVTFSQSSNYANRFEDINDATFEDGVKYSVGGYFIPNYNSFTSYWSKITYRGGLKYEETGLVVNNKTIKDAGFTLGVGLPLGGTFSNINIGLEYGKRGTRDAALVEENYLNISLGLSLNDRWFVKRKFD